VAHTSDHFSARTADFLAVPVPIVKVFS